CRILRQGLQPPVDSDEARPPLAIGRGLLKTRDGRVVIMQGDVNEREVILADRQRFRQSRELRQMTARFGLFAGSGEYGGEGRERPLALRRLGSTPRIGNGIGMHALYAQDPRVTR